MVSVQLAWPPVATKLSKRSVHGHGRRYITSAWQDFVVSWPPPSANPGQLSYSHKHVRTLIPNDALASTGNGIPYFVPGCALRHMGTRVITLPMNTVSTPCHQDMPACRQTGRQHCSIEQVWTRLLWQLLSLLLQNGKH